MKQYKNLAFEGGGVKGVGYVGALEILDNHGILKNIERVAGTSAGAITACLVSLKYSAESIKNTVKEMDLGSFNDKQGLLRKFKKYGLHPGNTFLDWIKKQIQNSGHGFSGNATFSDFNKAGCRDLSVFAANIYTHELKEFSFSTTPKTIVAEAVRASMSIPLYFDAWQFSNNTPDDNLYVDGGLVLNYPITAFDKDGPNQETLGFRLEDLNYKRVLNKFGEGHMVKYVKNTFETLLRAQNINFYRHPDHLSRSVIIDDLGIPATNFNISEENKNALIKSGESAMSSFLAK